jgi:hypothetical protein
MQQTIKETEIITEINRLIPNVKINSTRTGNEKQVYSAHFFIPPENKYLSKSEYFFKGKLNFIHFTNLFAIQSIISERNLRLYNLHNLNDPREYSFAGNLITFNKENKIDAQDNFYLLSMCQPELLTNSTEIEFNMWRLYGSNGQGIAIELSYAECPPLEWKDYFLSTVQYGTESKTKLKELSKLLRQLDNAKPQVRVDLGQIICFHKSRLFKLEGETRLLFDARKIKVVGNSRYKSKDGDITSPSIKTDILKSSVGTKEIKYLELPIFHEKFVPVYDNNAIPIPKIERIILGYQFNDNFKKVATHLADLCKQRLGYIPKIEKSRLTKYYHDIP